MSSEKSFCSFFAVLSPFCEFGPAFVLSEDGFEVWFELFPCPFLWLALPPCYTPAGIPPGPQVIINDHPEMPNMELASTHFRQSHDAQYGTRVDALSEFMNDHSTMTKWPA